MKVYILQDNTIRGRYPVVKKHLFVLGLTNFKKALETYQI